jgi:hypothetical protein
VAHHPSDEQKAILCELIRAHTGDIQNDWNGKHYTQDEAIDYVMNYGKETMNEAIRLCPDCGKVMNPVFRPNEFLPYKWVCRCGKLVKT